MQPGRCVNHPSRETELRCRACGRWVCERCRRTFLGQAYCRRRCVVAGASRRSLSAAVAALLRPVEPVRAVAVVAAAATSLLVAVGVLGVRLLAERGAATGPAPVAEARPLSATVARDGDGWRLRVEGPPGTEVLVVLDGDPAALLALDPEGAAEMASADAMPEAVELRVLGAAVATAPVPPAEAAAPVPSGTPTPSPSPQPSPSPTASPAPTRSSTPTPTATATPSPTPTPMPTRRPAPPELARPGPPEPRIPAPPILHLVTDAGSRIAITFDGGASSNGTEQLLTMLRELDLQATLFLTGRFIEREPALLRRALLDGHEVGNHTWSHPRLTTYAENGRHRLHPEMTRERLHEELLRTEEAFRRATGRPLAPLWRAPYGEENPDLRRWAAEIGYLHVRWSSLKGSSLDSWDWVENEHSPLFEDADQMVDRLLGFPHLEGGIVLMHLASERSEPPWRALPRLVETLRGRRIEPVRVTDLLERSETWRPRLEAVRQRHHELDPG